MSRPMPTLDPMGYTNAIQIKADKAICYFYVAQYSQTTLFRGKIASLQKIIQEYGNNAAKLRDMLYTTLSDYLNRIFLEATVTVDVTETVTGINLQIKAIIRDTAGTADIANLINVQNSQIRSIIDLNNDGKLMLAGASLYSR